MLYPVWALENQFQNKNGSNLVNGKVYVYHQGRSTLANIFQDEDGNFAQSNPVTLDANARGVAYADSSFVYTIVVCDFYNKELFSYDTRIGGAGGTSGSKIVIHDDTLSGYGTTYSPLGVVTFPLGVDETLTAYTATVGGKESLVFGVEGDWFNNTFNSALSSKVDLSAFEECCNEVNNSLSGKVDLSALNNYYNKTEINSALSERVTYEFLNENVYKKYQTSSKEELASAFASAGQGGSGDCPWLSGGKQIQETQLITPNMVIQVLSSFDLSGNKNHFIGVKGGTYRFPSSYELVDDIAQTYAFMPTSSMSEYLTTATFSSYSSTTDTRITNVNEKANSGLSLATNNLYNKLDISSFNAWTASTTATMSASGRTCLIGEDNVLVIAPGGVNDVILQGFGNSGTYEDFGQGYENSSFQYAFTQGRYNSANSEALAQGYENSATKNALAQGSTNKAYYASLAQGIVNTALAYSLAQGYENSANSYSFAQGASNTAFDNSLTQGNGNFADHYSVAIGHDNNSYDFGFAFGNYLKASGLMALGILNKVSSNASFVIGNGYFDDDTYSAVYSDSFIIFKDGSLSAAGDISANGKKLTNSNCYCIKFTNELTSVNLSSYDSFDKVTVINPIEYGNNCVLNYNGNVKSIASGVWVDLVNNENEWLFTNSGLMNRNWWE